MSKSRLASIDALRGAAALAVVVHHAAIGLRPEKFATIADWLGHAMSLVCSYGRVGVALFFVISGFCIHLSWARSFGGGEVSEPQLLAFWKRRLVRLYPTYLVALGLYLGVQLLTGEIEGTAFDLYNIGSHLLMLHSFDERTIFAVDGVFWTLAIEEQLYLLYFVLLKLRGRVGWPKTLAICFLARAGWFGLVLLVNHVSRGYRLPHSGGGPAHWFVWALGAISVEAMSGFHLPRWCRRWSVAAVCFLAAVLCDAVTSRHLFGAIGWRLAWLLGDPFWGLGFFVLVNALTALELRWKHRGKLPLAVAGLAGLGLFSYSLYLVHGFVLRYLAAIVLGAFGLPDDSLHRILLTPLCVGFAFVFFLLFEKPFIRIAASTRGPISSEMPAPAPAASHPAVARHPSSILRPTRGGNRRVRAAVEHRAGAEEA